MKNSGSLIFNSLISICLIYLSYDIVFCFEEYLAPKRTMRSKQNGYILFVLVYLLAFLQICIALLPINQIKKNSIKIIKSWS